MTAERTGQNRINYNLVRGISCDLATREVQTTSAHLMLEADGLSALGLSPESEGVIPVSEAGELFYFAGNDQLTSISAKRKLDNQGRDWFTNMLVNIYERYLLWQDQRKQRA